MGHVEQPVVAEGFKGSIHVFLSSAWEATLVRNGAGEGGRPGLGWLRIFFCDWKFGSPLGGGLNCKRFYPSLLEPPHADQKRSALWPLCWEEVNARLGMRQVFCLGCFCDLFWVDR
jgi:hypothetical protein